MDINCNLAKSPYICFFFGFTLATHLSLVNVLPPSLPTRVSPCRSHKTQPETRSTRTSDSLSRSLETDSMSLSGVPPTIKELVQHSAQILSDYNIFRVSSSQPQRTLR